MTRWYLPILTNKRSDTIIKNISQYVERQNLNDIIPALRVQKGDLRGGYYLFVAFDADDPLEIPTETRELIENLNLGQALKEGNDLDDILKMARGEVDIHSFRLHLTYRKPERDSVSPLDLSVATENTLADKTSSYTTLFYWLSTQRYGTWQKLKETCQTLGFETGRGQARHIQRRLWLLGHLAISANGQHWHILPPTLLETAPRTAVLTGQRWPALLKKIGEVEGITLISTPQPQKDAPETVTIHAESEAAFDTLMDKLPTVKWGGYAAARLAALLPDYADNLSLYTPISLEPSYFKFERWEQGSFRSISSAPTLSGFYQLKPRLEQEIRLEQTLFYDATDQHWYQGDWYGLRYRALCEAGETHPATYNSTAATLTIPDATRWPDLYEQALVLCSGTLPRRENDNLVYVNVPLETARMLAVKLTAQFKEV